MQPTTSIPRPDLLATLIPAPIPRSTLTLHTSRDADEFTLTLEEDCPTCRGDGTIEVDVPGGVWTSWQGGMWVPDSRRHDCETCEALGYRSRTRCVRCGHLHANDEWGIARDEIECECSAEDVMEAVRQHANLRIALDRVEAAAESLARYGVHPVVNASSVPWNEFLALATEAGVPADSNRIGGIVVHSARVSAHVVIYSERGEQ